ncbi:MAG: O-antigen ligase family protein [Syntrophomonadaceae bacterium]|nr:O-antigen ligase family protein [Syntrophomonadaceae bacterium]
MLIENLVVYIFAAIIGLILLLLIFKQPYLGVAFSIAILPIIDIFSSIPLFSSISLPIGLATLVAYLFRSKRLEKKGKRRMEAVYLLALIFIFWVVVSNPEAAILGEDRFWIFTFAQLWILMFLSGELLDTPQKQKNTMLMFALAAVVSAIFAITQGEIAETATTSARVSGLATNANQAARYFVIALVFFYYLRTKTETPLLKIFYLVGILITFFGVFFTVSRSGMLLLFGALGLILIFQPRVKNKVGLIILTIVALIALSFFAESIFIIIGDIFPAIEEGSDTVGLRYNLWRAGWDMWLDHPITGVGIGQYNHLLRRYMIGFEGPTVGFASPHNTYVQVLSETGFIGFVLFMAMLIRAFQNLWPSPSANSAEFGSLRDTWFIILLVISVGGITITDLGNKIFWMVLGVSAVLANKEPVKSKESSRQAIAKTSATSIRMRRWMKNTK